MLSAAQITSMQAVIARSLDVTLPLERNTPGVDSYGHATESWASIPSVQITTIKASATVLQLYAGVIGSQRAEMIRAMQTSDIKQGDRATYDGLKWIVHEVQNSESYTWTKEYLMVVIT